jgi:hypothetical protein
LKGLPYSDHATEDGDVSLNKLLGCKGKKLFIQDFFWVLAGIVVEACYIGFL